MEPFDPDMFFHTVAVRKLAEGVDAEGGVVEVFGEPGPDLPCRVHEVRDSAVFGSGHQELSVMMVRVAFPADPGVVKGDRLVYRADDIRAIGPSYARDGEGALFRVDGRIID